MNKKEFIKFVENCRPAYQLGEVVKYDNYHWHIVSLEYLIPEETISYFLVRFTNDENVVYHEIGEKELQKHNR